MSIKQEPYIYTLKAILDMNEVYDSGDCEQIRRGVIGERSSEPLPQYVALEEYKKLQTSIQMFRKWFESNACLSNEKEFNKIITKMIEVFGPIKSDGQIPITKQANR